MTFLSFNFTPSITRAIEHCGYTSPTEIQQQAIPHLLQGKDILGLAQTGTGKTAAFVLPTLQKLSTAPNGKLRALILTPTRELAEQIYSNTNELAQGSPIRSCTIYGGVSKFNQVKRLKRGVDIAVACPGRLLDHIRDNNIDLRYIDTLILDEADQMLDQGFLPDIRRILQHLPAKKQSLVFSATMPEEIERFVRDILVNPVRIEVDHKRPAPTIEHILYNVSMQKKFDLLKQLLKSEDLSTAIVFTRTKHKAKRLALQLEKAGHPAASIQGNLSQAKRKQALDGFRNGTYTILVATDIAARGIDVPGISHVINFDVPDTVEAYTHRTGRTGRATCKGKALTFVTPDDGKVVKILERVFGKRIQRQSLEGFTTTEASPHQNGRSTTAKRHTKTPGRSFGPSRRSKRNRQASSMR